MYRIIVIFLLAFSTPAFAVIKPSQKKRSPQERKQQAALEKLRGSKELADYSKAIETSTALGLYTKADSLITISMPIARRCKDSVEYYEFLRVQARLFTILNRYNEALRLFEDCLDFQRQKGFWEQEGLVLVNLMEFYRSINQYALAREEVNYLINHPNFEQLSNKVKAIAYHRFAAVMGEYKRDLDSTILLSNISLSYSEPDSLLDEMGTSYLELGFAYIQLKEARAIAYFDKAFEVFQKQKRIHYMCNTLMHIAGYYMRVQNDEIALRYLDSARSLGKPYELPGFIPTLYEKKAKVLYRLGFGDEAYILRDSSAILKKAELDQRFSDQLVLQARRFQTDLALSRLRIAESEQKQILEEASSKDLQRNLILAALGVLILFVIGLYYFFRRLARSKQHLEESQSALFGANQELINTLNEKDGLIEEVHHRVKNNLQLITSMIRVQQFQQQDVMTQESKAMVNEILNRVSAMAVVHEKLYAQQQISQLRAKEYFSGLIQELKTLGGSFHKRLDVEVEAEDVILGVTQGIALGMILSELVSNSLKHAFVMQDHPLIRIHIQKTQEGGRAKVSFAYEDNGQGYEEKSEMGMGNRLVMLFIRQLEADYELDSKDRFYLKLAYWED